MATKRSIARFAGFLVLGLLSCTIIQDGDIDSVDDFELVKLSSIQFTAPTTTGIASREFKMVYDSVQNFTDAATGSKITRKVGYSMPNISSSKLKLRSGSTKVTGFYIYYTDTKQPYTLGVHEQDSVVELYRFRYSSSGQLNRIITIINPVDNAYPIWFSRDTLEYTSGLISKVTRKGDGAATYNVQYQTHNSSSYFSNINSLYAVSAADCPNGDSNTCAVYQCTGCGSGGGSGSNSALPSLRLAVIEAGDAPLRLTIQDVRAGDANNRVADYYYFHPTMILRGQLQGGQHLLPIYMLDWWVKGAQTAVSASVLNKSEDVSFDFFYER